MRRLLPLIALGLALGACRPPPVTMQEGPREYVATDYESILKRWTREESLYLFDELERALTVSATFETWDFRWAYVIRYAQDYRLTVPQRQRLLRERLEETRANHDFFIALYGAEQRFNDLTRKDTAWIVRLIDSTGSETAPTQVESIRRPNIMEQRYYPYNTVWRKAFRLRFPTRGTDGRPAIAPDAEWVGLRFAGAWGNFDLVWELDEPGAEGAPTPQAAAAYRPTRGRLSASR